MNFSGNTIGFIVKFYLRNHILKIFFELMDVSVFKQKRKFRKWPKVLNGKITWEINIFDYHSNSILKGIFHSITTYV